MRNFAALLTLLSLKNKKMSNRTKALDALLNRTISKVERAGEKVSDYYGSNVFGKEAMQAFLMKHTFEKLTDIIEKDGKMDEAIANEVAAGMKNWAMSKGVTHYTHWFQPLTGSTAEKHDAFFKLNGDKAVEHFSGSALAQQEPDASSFPNGGIRNTFEARGYTAWDPNSPAFIFDGLAGKTLCIPTIFVSYTGESLDYKAPLLKSLHALEDAGLPVCRLFERNINRLHTTLGIEQEYFLIDSALFKARPDLVMAGRTVFGHAPARGQQLSDHYFGSISDRVLNFMVDVEQEAHKLGIPLTTRHNEVAPSQFECAPMFARINLACDQNQLLMDLMDKIAKKHNFAILFHEKPFKGVNGSGKHNNWSLSTDTGINLLSPGKTPKNNLMFLTFFVNTIKAFFDNADMIRAAIASAGNDHRLGANEAPPAIMSVFLGEQLNRILNEIENSDFVNNDDDVKNLMKHGIKSLPEILLDNTDRNRTSPFAFTGNKFELRAVGSAANSAFVMTVLNTIVAAQLRKFMVDVEQLIGDTGNKETAILTVLQGYIKASRAVRFEGNGYSQEWADEAKKRKLPNVRNTPEALKALVTQRAVKLFREEKVFTSSEINARYMVALDNYALKIQIEGRIMAELATAYIVPAAVKYQNVLINNLKGQKELGIDASIYEPQLALVNEISGHIAGAKSLADALSYAIDGLEGGEHGGGNQVESYNTALGYCNDVKAAYFDALRHHVDSLETLIDDASWPLPKYREMLFM